MKEIFRLGLVGCAAAVVVSASEGAIVREYGRVTGKADAPLPGKTVAEDMLRDAQAWTNVVNLDSLLDITFERSETGRGQVRLSGTKDKGDVGLRLTSRPFAWPRHGLGYALSFEIKARPAVLQSGGAWPWGSAVIWQDAKGRELAHDVFPLTGNPGEFREVVLFGSMPFSAASFSVRLGFDRPNPKKGEFIVIRNMRMGFMERDLDPNWTPVPMPEMPRVRLVSPSPTLDQNAPLRVSVVSGRPLDWGQIAVSVDGEDVSKVVRRNGNVLEYTPIQPWTNGLHAARISVFDPLTQTSFAADKRFLVGERPVRTVVRLREDGMALVDGKPFFPIGIFGVRKREENGWDFGRAMADLKAGGFNTVHSYEVDGADEFLDAAARQGLKVWTAMYAPTARFCGNLRHRPEVLAWYIGDDTSMHATVPEVHDRDDNVRACDPNRITAQADVMNSGDAVSSYARYVKATDVFMPEIYPVVGPEPDSSPDCVARTIRDLERFKDDVAAAGDSKPHAVWPIIQYFKGYKSWKRFPTRRELFAMSYAAVIHGAHGVLWYTYGGTPANGDYGITTSPEVWGNMTNLATRLNEMSPVFLAPPCPQPKKPMILSGPEKDVLGFDSISTLYKRFGDSTYVFAVNGATNAVRAVLSAPDGASDVRVRYENRSVRIVGKSFEDVFEPFDVHVYISK